MKHAVPQEQKPSWLQMALGKAVGWEHWVSREASIQSLQGAVTTILHRDNKIVGTFPVSDAKLLRILLISYSVVPHHCAANYKPLPLSANKNNFVSNLKRELYFATTLI